MLVGKVHNDFMLGPVGADPPTLEISGPQTILGDAKELETQPVDITGLNQSSVKQVPLDLQPEIAELIGEPIVAVRITLLELKNEVTIADIPVEYDLTSGRDAEIIYHFKPPTVSITAEIPKRMAQKPEELKNLFQARVKPETFRAGSHNLKVEVESAQQFKVIAVSPATVTLEISETQKLKVRK